MVEIEAVELFRGLSHEELSGLRKISHEKPFAKGARIFSEGDPGDGLYVVKSGSVQIAHIVGSEPRHVFSVFGPGAIFGEMAVVEDQPRSATAVAAGDSLLYFIPREEMRLLLKNSPLLAFNLLQMISHRLRTFNQYHLRELVQSESLAIIGRFAQGIIHDLKNPLNIIRLSSEIFDLPGINPEAKATAHSRIQRQVDRINDMVSDILIFTQGTSKTTDFQIRDYREFVLKLLPDLNHEAELKAAHIELQGDVPPAQLKLDTRRFSRVFYNLIGNATDIMLRGGAIFLRFRRDNHEVITELEDTGPGIAPEMAGCLFEPFATHGKTKGTGLGLSICKKIVEDHGGKIWARSEPGRGAIFSFTLPLLK